MNSSQNTERSQTPQQKDLLQQIEDYSKALEKTPQDQQMLFQRASCYIKLRKFLLAERDSFKIQEIIRKQSLQVLPNLKQIFLKQRITILFKLGEYLQALELCNQLEQEVINEEEKKEISSISDKCQQSILNNISEEAYKEGELIKKKVKENKKFKENGIYYVISKKWYKI